MNIPQEGKPPTRRVVGKPEISLFGVKIETADWLPGDSIAVVTSGLTQEVQQPDGRIKEYEVRPPEMFVIKNVGSGQKGE